MIFPRPLFFAAFLALATPLLAEKPTYPDSEAGQHVGEEATVTGKLAAITKSSKGHAYLNLGDRFPRQAFTGVIFASDEAAVGDVKQYEGKQIALTGKIENSPDGKPQIVLRKADQIALAGGGTTATAGPAAPAAAPMPAPTSSTPPPPTPAAPPPPPAPVVASAATAPPTPAAPTAKIALASNWASPGQGSEMIRKDLARLFGGQSLPPATDAPVMVYPDIPYLTPLAVAKKRLNVEGASPSTLRITCPGLPAGSLTSHAFAGVFPGGFTQLYLITDTADQVVSVLTIDENTRQRTADLTDTDGYHTYNFITQRVKGTNDLVVKHTIAPEGAPPGTIVVDSMLIDPKDQATPAPYRSTKSTSTSTKTYAPRTPKTGKVMERSRWYVPVPLVNLILKCSSGR